MNDNGYNNNRQYHGQQTGSFYEYVIPDKLIPKMNPIITTAIVVIGLGFLYYMRIKKDYVVGFLCVGLFWVVSGIWYVTDKRFLFRKHAMNMLYPIIGFFLTLITGYILLSRNILSLPKIEGKLLSMVVGAGIACIGLLGLILNGIAFSYLKQVCTEQVQAVYVYKKQRRKNYQAINAPIFEYQMRGNTYWVAENYRSVIMLSMGERYDLLVNPNEPREFYRIGDLSRLKTKILGSILIFVGGFVCCYF